MKAVKVTVNGKTYEVEVGDVNASSLQVKVDGNTYQVEMDLPEVASVRKPTSAPAPAPAVYSPVAAPAAAPTPVVNGGAKAVRAPMPGTVLEVNVQLGETVSRGQQLLILEAMKMKNAIRAPFDGVVSGIHVTDGQKVAYNDPMVSFE